VLEFFVIFIVILEMLMIFSFVIIINKIIMLKFTNKDISLL